MYDLDGTVCEIKHNGTAYYFYKNLQGDVIAITDDTGAIVARYTYDAWGKCTIISDTSDVTYGMGWKTFEKGCVADSSHLFGGYFRLYNRCRGVDIGFGIYNVVRWFEKKDGSEGLN